MGKTNAERFVAVERRAQELNQAVISLMESTPKGEVWLEVVRAKDSLTRVVKLAQQELENEPWRVKDRELARQAILLRKQARERAGQKGVIQTRVVKGKLRHGLEKGQDARMAEVWFHGTTAEFDLLGARAPRSETRGFNPRLGLHFASEFQSAEGFADGLYRHGPSRSRPGRVYSVRLRSSQVKIFESERVMNGDFFNFCLEKGLLKPSEVESVRSYRRMPKGEIGGNAWWEKVTVSAACDIAASFKHLDKAVGAYRDNLTHQGYDAVVYLNDIEGFASPCAIVFDDKQVEVVETLGLTQTQEDLDRARNPTDFRRRLEGLVLGA